MPSEDAEAHIRQARSLLTGYGPQMTPGERAIALACLAQAELLAGGVTLDSKTQGAVLAMGDAAETFAKAVRELTRRLDRM